MTDDDVSGDSETEALLLIMRHEVLRLLDEYPYVDFSIASKSPLLMAALDRLSEKGAL